MKIIFSFMLFIIYTMPVYSDDGLKVIVSPTPKSHAWWLRITFIPGHKQVCSIPIEQLDPTWVLASPLTKEAIPHDILFENGQDSMLQNKVDFMQKGDFNGDGIEDLAIVGVFQKKDKQMGNFFLILTKGNDLWKKAFMKTWASNEAGFLGLRTDRSNLYLMFCMECGGVSAVAWDKKLKAYQIQKSVDAEISEEK